MDKKFDVFDSEIFDQTELSETSEFWQDLGSAPKANYAVVAESRERARSTITSAINEVPQEKPYAYQILVACPFELYWDVCGVGFKLSKTEGEAPINASSWKVQRTDDGYTLLTVETTTNLPRALYQLPNNEANSYIGIENATPVLKESAFPTESFVPIRPAVQVGDRLGFPTKGAFYHFIDGKLIHEYIMEGTTTLHATYSHDRVIDSDIKYTLSDTILLPWKRHNRVVTNQYLVYRSAPLLPEELEEHSISQEWIENEGIELDVEAIVQTQQDAKVARELADGTDIVYKVQSGDSLSVVAERFGSTLEELTQLNPSVEAPDYPIDIDDILILAYDTSESDFANRKTLPPVPIAQYTRGVNTDYHFDRERIIDDVAPIFKGSVHPSMTVVNAAKVEGEITEDYAAIIPVRYAYDTSHQAPKASGNFTGGCFELTMPDNSELLHYGLRQLRDGWVYVFDEQTEQLDEYEIIGQQFINHDVDSDSRVSCLRYPGYTQLKLSFSDHPWTDRIKQVMQTDSELRDNWMRHLDLSCDEEQHVGGLEVLNTEVADIHPSPVHNFDGSSVPLENSTQSASDESPSSLAKAASTPDAWKADIHDGKTTKTIVVALDDPKADICDLTLALIAPIIERTNLPHGEENQHKYEMAEVIRMIGRVQIPENEWASTKITQENYLTFEDEFHRVLERMYLNTLEDDYHDVLDPFPNQKGNTSQQYLKDFESEWGVTPTDAHLADWRHKRGFRPHADWVGLTNFCQMVESTLRDNQKEITQWSSLLMQSLEQLGQNMMRLGIDDQTDEGQVEYLDMMNWVGTSLQQSVVDVPTATAFDTLFHQDNLLTLAPFGGSLELKQSITEYIVETLELDQSAGVTAKELLDAQLMKDESYASGFSWKDLSTKDLTGIANKFESLYSYDDVTKKAWFQALDGALQAVFSAMKAGINGAAQLSWAGVVPIVTYNQFPKNKIGQTIANARLLFVEKFVSSAGIELTMDTQYKQTLEGFHKNVREKAALELKIGDGKPTRAQRRALQRLDQKLEYKQPNFMTVKQKVNDINLNAAGEAHAVRLRSNAKQNANELYGQMGGSSVMILGLNMFNLSGLVAEVALLPDNTPEKDQINEQIKASAAWTLSAAADLAKCISLARMQSIVPDAGQLSYSRIMARWGSDKRLVSQLNTFRYTGIAASAFGAIAAGYEAYKTDLRADETDYDAERTLLRLKAAVLAGEAGISLAMGVQFFIAKSSGGALGALFAPWMVVGAFALGVASLIIDSILAQVRLSPLEEWVRNGSWGRETSVSWNHKEEKIELEKILNQPKAEFVLDDKLIVDYKQAGGYPIPVYEYHKTLRVSLPESHERCFVFGSSLSKEPVELDTLFIELDGNHYYEIVLLPQQQASQNAAVTLVFHGRSEYCYFVAGSKGEATVTVTVPTNKQLNLIKETE